MAQNSEKDLDRQTAKPPKEESEVQWIEYEHDDVDICQGARFC